jgi:O-antigen/teichoic acid export membrane protein
MSCLGQNQLLQRGSVPKGQSLSNTTLDRETTQTTLTTAELRAKLLEARNESSSATQKPSANASGRSLVRNILTSYVASAVGMITGLVVTPLLVRHLGSTDFGLWVLIGSLAGYIGLVEVGIGTATAKRVAECRATGDKKRLEEVLGTAFSLYLVIFLIVLLATGILQMYLGNFFQIPADRLLLARICLVVVGISHAIGFLFIVQSAILFGAGRLDLMSGFGMAISTAAAIIQSILVVNGYGLLELAATMVASTVVSGCVGRYIISKHFPDISVRARSGTRSMALELLKFGSRNSVIAICGTLAFNADALIIGLLLPVSNVTHYAVASKLTNLVRTVAIKPIDVLTPAYAHSHALKDTGRQFRLYTESVATALALALPFVIVLCVFGDRIITAWMGPGHDASYPVLVTLSLVLALQLQGHANFALMTATERNVLLMKVVIIGAPVNVLLSVLFTHKFGLLGPALGSLVTVAVLDALILPMRTCRDFGFSYRQYLSYSIIPMLIPTCVTLLLAVIMRHYIIRPGGIWLMLSCASTVLMFWILWLAVGVGHERRTAYKQRIQAFIKR